MKDIKKLTDKELEDSISQSILKQKAKLAKYGIDIGKHWKEMLSSLEKKS